ncbi:hypothetical protein DN069_06590 [Streptacidiphilus pinicola]|uniref:Peptide chain release factor 1 n=1 Tax=Streptacidiphilus pinicola TaxID=2219663 RepID=A0A2X0IMS9_9ACTN|nr:hypothetical protein [Streptacidiphilus pinicola]RAG86472.1 hypothetical protein DN069_06590 [Streptacidiphilus pinicola]
MELTFLHPLLDRPGPWASVIIDTSRSTEDAAKQTELRRRAAARELTRLGADRRSVDALVSTLQHEPTSGSPAGRALYATEGRVVLDLELTYAPAGVTTAWSALPRLAPLLSLRAEEPEVLLALIDRTGADLQVGNGHGRRPLAGAQGQQWRGRGHRSIPADRYEWHYQHRVEDSWDRTAQVIADEVTRQQAGCPECVLVLAGDARERHEVARRLPAPLRSAVVQLRTGGRAPGGADHALDHELECLCAYIVAEHVERAFADLAAGRSRDPGTGRERAPGAERRTAEGVPQAIHAARDRSLATLLLDPSAPDATRTVWTGTEPLLLAVERAEVQRLGARYPHPARTDDVLLRAAAALDAQALAIPPGGPGPVGGVGALLRWPQAASAA